MRSDSLGRSATSTTRDDNAPMLAGVDRLGFKPKKDVVFIPVSRDAPDTVEAFLTMGRAYLAELNTPPTFDHEKFLQSILGKIGESDRWLELLRVGDKVSGFVHAKIDRDERPGWGCILELGIVPEMRRCGWGTTLYEHVAALMRERNVSQVWLTSDADAEPFWRRVGFHETGGLEHDMKVLVATL